MWVLAYLSNSPALARHHIAQNQVHGRSLLAYRESKVQLFLRKTRMKLTALINKIQARDPRVFPAWEVLRMATIEGAQAVGLGDEVGSLETGKEADLILVDMTALNPSPVLDAPVRQARLRAAQPGLCREWARGQDGNGRGQSAGARRRGADCRRKRRSR